MSQSATPATQNDMTTSLETFEKERFCGFLHRHSEATGKPETRDETRGSTKTILSCETSGDFHNWQHNKRTGFAASPIDTAKPREHQILETRYVLRTKTSISYETSSNFDTLPASKSTFSYEFSLEPENLQPQNRCFVRGFRQFSAHAQNATPATEFAPCHHLTQPCQCDLQKTRNTRLKCCACHEKWRWTRPKCCACHENCNTSSENVTKVLRLPRKTTFDTFQNTFECHEVPRLPRETKQRHVCNPQKGSPLQNFP